MKIQAALYAAVCAILGMASQVKEASAAPTSLLGSETRMERRGRGGTAKVMEEPLLPKGVESSSTTPLPKEVKKAKTYKEKTPKAQEETMTSSSSKKTQKLLSPGDSLAMNHELLSGSFPSGLGGMSRL